MSIRVGVSIYFDQVYWAYIVIFMGYTTSILCDLTNEGV